MPVTRAVVPTGRLSLRVTPNRHGRAALAVYRPLAIRGRMMRWAVSAASAVPWPARRAEPIVDEIVRELGLRVDGICLMASSSPGRRVVGLAAAGRLVAVAKVGPPTDDGLRREADALMRLRPAGSVPVPRLLDTWTSADAVVCVTAPVPGPPRRDAATALGIALRLAEAGWTHGDLAPWNILGAEPTLLDWERSHPEVRPMFDLAHFVVQSETLLRRGDPYAMREQLCGRRGVGAAYLARTGQDAAAAPALVLSYLDIVEPGAPPAQRRALAGLRAVLR